MFKKEDLCENEWNKKKIKFILRKPETKYGKGEKSNITRKWLKHTCAVGKLAG